MGVRVIYDEKENMAAIYCSVVDIVFGPAIYGDEKVDAERLAWKFLQWLPQDARQYRDDELMAKWSDFRFLNWHECDSCSDELVTDQEVDCRKCIRTCDECADRDVDTEPKSEPGKKARRLCEECRK